MTETYRVQPVSHAICGSIRPPGSKSITNRALVCAALAQGKSNLIGILHSDDTRVMIDALNALGIAIGTEDRQDSATEVTTVSGAGGQIPALEAELFVGNSGTTIRFLTAMLTLGRGAFRLDGVPRMRSRPIGDLVEALNGLGAQVQCEAGNDCPPVLVHANGLPGGEATVRGNLSSQFLSGLLMTAPCADSSITLSIEGELVSRPYIEITRQVMTSFGASATPSKDGQEYLVDPTGYKGCEYPIEPDASAASYFWAAAAITGGEVTVQGLTRNSLQGDVAFVDCLEAMGCEVIYETDSITVRGRPLRGITVDMNAISDTAQTLAAVALFAEGTTQITGIAHNRHKETDRIGDLATELNKLGATVETLPDGLSITPGTLVGAEIETYDDHRMAMSLSLVGLMQDGVGIRDPECTSKTYPGFFRDLEELCQE